MTENDGQGSIKLLGGKLTLYRRPKSSWWWCGFYFKRNHIRSSTKTDDLARAKDFALQWYFKQQLQLLSGVTSPTKAKSLAVAADRAIEEYKQDAARNQRSKQYVTAISHVIASIKLLLGDVALDSVDQATWETLKQKVLERNSNMTQGTLHNYNTALRIIVKRAFFRSEIKQLPKFFNDTKGNQAPTPRTWFEPDEYRTLINALRSNIANHRKQLSIPF